MMHTHTHTHTHTHIHTHTEQMSHSHNPLENDPSSLYTNEIKTVYYFLSFQWRVDLSWFQCITVVKLVFSNRHWKQINRSLSGGGLWRQNIVCTETKIRWLFWTSCVYGHVATRTCFLVHHICCYSRNVMNYSCNELHCTHAIYIVYIPCTLYTCYVYRTYCTLYTWYTWPS